MQGNSAGPAAASQAGLATDECSGRRRWSVLASGGSGRGLALRSRRQGIGSSGEQGVNAIEVGDDPHAGIGGSRGGWLRRPARLLIHGGQQRSTGGIASVDGRDVRSGVRL